MNYTLKIFKENKSIQMVRTHSKRLFLKIARTIKWGDWPFKVYLKVASSRFPDVNLKPTVFYNDGVYENKVDFWFALNAFMEKDNMIIKKPEA